MRWCTIKIVETPTIQLKPIYPMENRIDLTQIKELNFDGWPKWIHDVVMELDEMYKREDKLLGWIEGTITEAKDYVTYDKEDEMWVYDESKSSNPALDAMDFVIDLSTTDLKSI